MGSHPRLGGFTRQSNTEGKLSKDYVQVDSMCRDEVGKKVAVIVIATSVDVDPDWLTQCRSPEASHTNVELILAAALSVLSLLRVCSRSRLAFSP